MTILSHQQELTRNLSVCLMVIFLCATNLKSQSVDALITEAEQFAAEGNALCGQADPDYVQCRDKFLLAAEKYFEAKDYNKSVEFYNSVSYLYNALNDNYNYEKSCIKAYEVAKTYLPSEDPHSIRALEQLNNSYYKLSDYTKSIDILHEVYELRKNHNHKPIDLMITAQNLFNAYKFCGDMEKSKQYLANAERHFFDIKDPNENPYYHEVALDFYNSKSRIFEKLNQLDSSLSQTKQVLRTIDKNKISKSKLCKTYLMATDYASRLGSSQEALGFLKQAEKYIGTNNYYKIYFYETKAKLEAANENHDKALRSFRDAHQLAEETNKRNTPSFRSKRLMDMYKSSQNLTDIAGSHDILMEGYTSNLLDSTLINQTVLAADNFTNKLEALFFTSELANHYLRLSQNTSDQSKIEAAWNKYLLSVDLIKAIRQEIFTEESKKDLVKQSQNIFENAIACAVSLNKETGKKSYLEKALYISEQNRALGLLDKISDQAAKSYASIPDSITLKERALTQRLNQAKKIFFVSKNGSNNKIESKKEVDKLNLELDQLVHKIEREYPKYHNLKYGSEDISISEIVQSKLKQNSAVIEYFVGGDQSFAFVLDGKSIHVYEIPDMAAVSFSVDTLSKMISQKPNSSDAVVQYQSFTRNASYLYDALIRPATELLPETHSSITFIPDGILNQIPYDLLLKNVGENTSYSLENLDYLFEDITPSYQYSISHWDKIDVSSGRKYKVEFSGYAPSFSTAAEANNRNCDAFELNNLNCNTEEVQTISKYLGGDIFQNKEATLKNFLDRIEDSKIIHLATHTCIDENNAGLNRLYFSDSDITMLELNGYNLNPELSVLSACNTGIGEYVAGDGVQSLAWAFMQAGSKSTLMSLWSIDDCSTSEFMDAYYYNLDKGERKDVALQNAKIDFLSQASKAKQHPFYWAPFITYGSMEPIQAESPFHSSYLLLLLPLVGLIFYFLIRKGS